MNQQQPPSQFQMFGAQPQAASAANRFMPYLRGMVGGGLVIGAAFMASTVVCPPGWSLPEIAGRAFGAAAKWEVWTSTEATVERERRVAEAVAKANADAQEKLQIAVIRETYAAQAKMQIDVENTRQALEVSSQSNSFNSLMAGLADAACMGAQLVRAAGAQNTGREFQNGAQATAGVTCGVGDQIRDGITRSQNRAVVAATTARGLPQAAPTMPVTQPVAVPQSRAIPAPSSPEQAGTVTTTPTPSRVKAPVPAEWRTAIRSLDDIYAINEPSEHFTPKAVSEAGVHASRVLPRYVYNRITDGLGTSEHDQDVFVERARIALSFVSRNP